MPNQSLTVLMSVYNGERFLSEAVESILNQTFYDFEFIIINDGSTDGTAKILQTYHDKRIKIVRSPDNIGLTKSLNEGLKLARGKYIARQDADDISLPKRLERQISYLEAQPDIALLGTWANSIDKRGKILWEMRPPSNPSLLRWAMLLKNNMIHSSVMFSAAKVMDLGGYDSSMVYSQDYDLWLRIMGNYKIAQLPEILVLWRDHSKGITEKHFVEQSNSADLLARRNILNLLKKEVCIEEIRNLKMVLQQRPVFSVCSVKRSADILQDIYNTVIDNWDLNSEGVRLITSDYAKMTRNIASMYANFERRGAFSILVKSIKADIRSILKALTWKYIVKIVVGPNWGTKIAKRINLN